MYLRPGFKNRGERMRFFHPDSLVMDLNRLKLLYQQDLDYGMTKDDGMELKWLHPKGAELADTRKAIKQKMKDIDRCISYIKGDKRT